MSNDFKFEWRFNFNNSKTYHIGWAKTDSESVVQNGADKELCGERLAGKLLYLNDVGEFEFILHNIQEMILALEVNNETNYFIGGHTDGSISTNKFQLFSVTPGEIFSVRQTDRHK